MKQYISKSALVAEMENLLDKGKYHDDYDCAYRDGNNDALYALKGRINALEVKESLTWEDIRDILDLYDEVTSIDYCSDIYGEVLKRFKAMKEK